MALSHAGTLTFCNIHTKPKDVEAKRWEAHLSYPASSVTIADIMPLTSFSTELKSITLLFHLLFKTNFKNCKWLIVLSMIT